MQMNGGQILGVMFQNCKDLLFIFLAKLRLLMDVNKIGSYLNVFTQKEEMTNFMNG